MKVTHSTYKIEATFKYERMIDVRLEGDLLPLATLSADERKNVIGAPFYRGEHAYDGGSPASPEPLDILVGVSGWKKTGERYVGSAYIVTYEPVFEGTEFVPWWCVTVNHAADISTVDNGVYRDGKLLGRLPVAYVRKTTGIFMPVVGFPYAGLEAALKAESLHAFEYYIKGATMAERVINVAVSETKKLRFIDDGKEVSLSEVTGWVIEANTQRGVSVPVISWKESRNLGHVRVPKDYPVSLSAWLESKRYPLRERLNKENPVSTARQRKSLGALKDAACAAAEPGWIEEHRLYVQAHVARNDAVAAEIERVRAMAKEMLPGR